MTIVARSPEQLRAHYEVEKELASRLRTASRQERRHLYSALYNELYQRVPDHPQLCRKSSPEERRAAAAEEMSLLRPLVDKNTTFLEIGPGDCALSLEMARHVRQVYAVDVSDEITTGLTPPANFQLILSDGCSIPVPPGSVHLAYSNQLMEHLHPEDALEQLENICAALAPAGQYVCITPNRWTGPHDVSQFFDPVATGFHLKEYTISELGSLFRRVGFAKVRVYASLKGRHFRLPTPLFLLCETVLRLLPGRLARSLANRFPFRSMLGIRIAGIK
jgi:SAM-dependent methyltransferase